MLCTGKNGEITYRQHPTLSLWDWHVKCPMMYMFKLASVEKTPLKGIHAMLHPINAHLRIMYT